MVKIYIMDGGGDYIKTKKRGINHKLQTKTKTKRTKTKKTKKKQKKTILTTTTNIDKNKCITKLGNPINEAIIYELFYESNSKKFNNLDYTKMMAYFTKTNPNKHYIIFPHYLINKTVDATIPLDMSLKDAKSHIKKLK